MTVTCEIERFLCKVAIDRLRRLLPIMFFGVIASLLASPPAKIPLPPPILAINAGVIVATIALWFLLRRDLLPQRFAHSTLMFVMLFAPAITIGGQYASGIPWMAMLITMELAVTSLQVKTRYVILTITMVIGAWAPLAFRDGGDFAIMQLSCVLGTGVVAIVGHRVLLSSMINAEVSRVDEQRLAEKLALELAERIRAEAAEAEARDQLAHAQRLEAIGTLAAGLAHDMNNILGGVRSFAELIGEATWDGELRREDVRRDCEQIVKEAERGASLTRSLLAFSRRGQYQRSPIRFKSIIASVQPILSRTLPKSIAIEYEDECESTIDADRSQIGQVLINLCLNSADAMPDGGRLQITARETVFDEGQSSSLGLARAGTWVVLTVADDGRGMVEDTRARIFEPFFTTKEVGKGTGLGMSMVYGAVHGHGGAITVKSAPGRGTTITIYLPTVASAPMAVAPDTTDERVLPSATVLVVDDESMLRAGTKRVLQRMRLVTLEAADGVQALEVFEQSNEIALVVLDMAMPRMGGAECFRRLRELAPTIPILVVSGYALESETQQLLTMGRAGFLEKPYSSLALRAEVERLLAPLGTLPLGGT